jgi:hypothetical protein
MSLRRSGLLRLLLFSLRIGLWFRMPCRSRTSFWLRVSFRQTMLRLTALRFAAVPGTSTLCTAAAITAGSTAELF